MAAGPEQLALFGAPQPLGAEARERITPAPAPAELHELARRLPPNIYAGTSSWSVPGWQGTVYAERATERRLAHRGLEAYAQHPLFQLVGIDRTFYAPIPTAAFRNYAEVVPAGFRFMVKAHDHLTLESFPDIPRYGQLRGQDNPRFLDPGYAAEAVIGPAVEGLGETLALIVFQLPPQSVPRLGGPRGFADRLFEFLSRLPRGPRYAIEVRNPELLSQDYGDALYAANTSHALTVYPGMPSIAEQAALGLHRIGPALVARWMLRPSLDFATALARYRPFSKLRDPDPRTREALAALLEEASRAARPAFVTINNKAEGCSPLSIIALLEALDARLSAAP